MKTIHDSTRYYADPPEAYVMAHETEPTPEVWNDAALIAYALSMRENGEVIYGGWYV